MRLSTTTKGRIRTAIAYVGTVLLVAYVFLTTDVHQFVEALSLANIPAFFVTEVVSAMAVYAMDSFCVYYLLKGLGYEIPFREVASIKGASYLLNILNYNLALAGMAALLARKCKGRFLQFASPFILLNLLDLSALCAIVLVGVLAGQQFLGPDIRVTLGIAAVGGLAAGPVLLSVSRLKTRWVWLGKIQSHRIVSALRMVTPVHYIEMMFLRAVFTSLYVFTAFFLLRSFHFSIGLEHLAVYQPILTFIFAIPVSIAGLGSTQIAAREFFAPYAPLGLDKVAAVDAYTTSSIVAALGLRVMIGILCMRGVASSLQEAEMPR